MSDMIRRFGHAIGQWLARSVECPHFYVKSAWAASLSVAEVLLELVEARVVPDIRRIKEANIQSIEAENRKRQAEADIRAAEAMLKLAEATEAANRATIHKRKDALAKAERLRVAAESAKTQAEADAIRSDAQSRRAVAQTEARARLIDAIGRLRQDGGELFVSAESLGRLLASNYAADLDGMLGIETAKQEPDLSER